MHTLEQGRQEGWHTMRMIYRAMAVALLLTVVGAWRHGQSGLAQERADGPI